MAVSLVIEAKLNGVWTDISADRAHRNDLPIRISGGIQGVGPGDLLANSGAFSFELDNSVHNAGATRGWYSPNSASKRSGWGIGTEVRAKITVGANPTFYRFAGWVDQIIPVTGLFDDQTVQVIAVDWLAQAATALCAGIAAQQNKTGDQLVASLVALVQFAPHGTSYDVGSDTFLYGLDDLDPAKSKVYEALNNVARSGFDFIYIKGDTASGDVLRFESHSARRTFTTDVFTIGDDPPSGQPGLALTGLDTSKRRGDAPNELRLTIHPRKIDVGNQVLYNLNVNASASQSIPPGGGSITIWAEYADPNQLAQSVAGTSMVAPVATTDFTLNSAANGSGTDITASCTVTATFFANTAKLVVTNNHGTLAGYITKLQLRGLGIYSYQGLTFDSLNASAQAAEGQVLVSIDMPYQSNTAQAQAIADYFITLYTSASWAIVPSLTLFCPVDDETTYQTLMSLNVSTPFSITETMAGFMGYPLWVNSWELEIDERNNLTVTIGPVPRDPNQYWSLGVAGLSELGVTTYLGPF